MHILSCIQVMDYRKYTQMSIKPVENSNEMTFLDHDKASTSYLNDKYEDQPKSETSSHNITQTCSFYS